MKLPFSLSLKFVFRLLLPGFLVSLALLPLLQVLLDLLNMPFPVAWAFPLLCLLFGWLFVVLDMHIYMLFEGRRYWPPPVKRALIKREEARLRRLASIVQGSKEQDRARYLEASVNLRRFPIDENGEYAVRAPTRIGNLILAYEYYPLHRYGMDAVFFWPRLWLLLDEDQRKELDDQQALADSAIYSSAAIFLGGIVCFVYFVAALICGDSIDLLPQPPVLLASTAICIAAACVLYRLSLEIQATFGEIFKSAFDVFRDRVKLSAVLDHIRREWPEALPENASSKEEYKAAWRYLHNYRVRVDGESVPAIARNSSLE